MGLSQPSGGDGNRTERNPQGDSAEAGKLMDLEPTALKKLVFTCDNTGVPHISCSETTITTRGQCHKTSESGSV